MSAGAIGATVIYEYMLGRDFKKDPVTKAGVNWIAKHYVVSDNLYYMYALERAGHALRHPKFGDHDWYMEGAKHPGQLPERRRLLGQEPTAREKNTGTPASRSSS